MIIGEKIENISEYSTTEKVIGKWIDGAEIYEKTFDFGENGFTIPRGTDWSASLSVGVNIDKIIGNGQAISLDELYTFPVQIFKETTNTSIELQCFLASNMIARYLTIQYTKTAPVTKKTTKKGGK